MYYSAQELDTIPPAALVEVTLLDNEKVIGLWDGAFSVGSKITGCQVLDNPPFGVRYVATADIRDIRTL